MLHELAPDALACLTAQHLERSLLRRDDGDLRARGTFTTGVLGRQERELVERQRPGRPAGKSEGHVSDEAAVDVLQQASDERHVHLAAERERAGNRLAGSRARCDEEDVVVKARVATRPDLVGVRVDGCEGPAPMRGAAAPCQARQIEAEHLADAEGLADGEGPVVEVEIRGDELDVDELAGRLPQGHHGFESGDAAPGDQNELFPTSGHPFRVGDCVPSGIRAGAEAAAGKPQVQSGRPPM